MTSTSDCTPSSQMSLRYSEGFGKVRLSSRCIFRPGEVTAGQGSYKQPCPPGLVDSTPRVRYVLDPVYPAPKTCEACMHALLCAELALGPLEA